MTQYDFQGQEKCFKILLSRFALFKSQTWGKNYLFSHISDP